VIFVGKRGKLRVRFGLIPERDRGDVVHQRQVSIAALPSQVLNGYAQITVEADGIGNMPAIQSKSLLRLVSPIRLDDLRLVASFSWFLGHVLRLQGNSGTTNISSGFIRALLVFQVQLPKIFFR
jgi:hypothetical protein